MLSRASILLSIDLDGEGWGWRAPAGRRFEVFAGHGRYFYGRTSVLVIACAAGLLIWAINSKPCCSGFINEMAGCTFGVYLIRDNNYVRPWLWQTVLRNAEWAESPWLIVTGGRFLCKIW